MPYGAANPAELPPIKDVETILDRAWDGGITTFDTAPVYGNAEQRLGAWIKRRGVIPHISTKLPALTKVPNSDVAKVVDDAIQGSIRHLGCAPATYLTHDAADYLRPAVRESLHHATARGTIGSFGLSVYTAEEVFAAIAAGPPAAIQLPISAFDQRMVDSGAVAACVATNVRLFARSVFLQGVMLMEVSQIPPALAGLKNAVAKFEDLCCEQGTTRPSFALRHVRDLKGIASTIVGAYTPDQLATLVSAAREPPLSEMQRTAIATIAQKVPKNLHDPRNWPRL
jgi:aryl-alcohol dehydrogenase-like predicted oxidoreductase